MQGNFDEKALQKAKALADSPTGRQLADALRQTDPDVMRKAEAQIAAGDYSQLAKTLAPLLASEDVKKLFRQLGG